jgi:hypothetical protein
MFTLAVMHSFRFVCSPWWLLVPGVAVCAIVWVALKFRRKMASILAGVCVAIALLMGVMLPLSWNTQYGTGSHGVRLLAAPVVSGNLHRMRSSGFSAWTSHGRIQIYFDSLDFYAPAHYSDWALGDKVGWWAYAITGTKSSALFRDELSLTKSDFIQKTLGFQLCWWNGSDPDGSDQYVNLCSITVPQWFILAISLIPPALWLRKRMREKWLRRRGFPPWRGGQIRQRADSFRHLIQFYPCQSSKPSPAPS